MLRKQIHHSPDWLPPAICRISLVNPLEPNWQDKSCNVLGSPLSSNRSKKNNKVMFLANSYSMVSIPQRKRYVRPPKVTKMIKRLLALCFFLCVCLWNAITKNFGFVLLFTFIFYTFQRKITSLIEVHLCFLSWFKFHWKMNKTTSLNNDHTTHSTTWNLFFKIFG